MLEAQELARLQRAIDGLSSSDSSGPPSPCDFFTETAEPQGHSTEGSPPHKSSEQGRQTADGDLLSKDIEGTAQEAERDGDAPATKAVLSKVASEEDEEFNIHLLLRQSRRLQQQQAQLEGEGNEQPASLPPVDIALEEAAEKVRQMQARRGKEAAERAARLAGAEVQHVSASGPWAESRRPAKKQQQVYVGLPVGVGWHVPLVGVEGRGGYKPAQGEEAGNGGTNTNAEEGRKRALTVKEREKLKRMKGQSSHATWKPETWMQLRQQYD